MISGAHVIIYSQDAEADRDFFKNVLGFKSVGGGWLIFKLPPAEIAFHPGEENNLHQFYLMCDDVKTEIAALAKKGVKCSKLTIERWGSITEVPLPGGGRVGLYQPKHPVAHSLK